MYFLCSFSISKVRELFLVSQTYLDISIGVTPMDLEILFVDVIDIKLRCSFDVPISKKERN